MGLALPTKSEDIIMPDKYVRIENCEVGIDSNSGLAFSVEIEEQFYWVPYSQCRKRVINDKARNSDSIEVAAWWAEKNGIEGTPC